MESHLVHWADMTAARIIQQLGDKERYILASGITPSGTVHFGNFREVITVDLVARALRDRGKKVRFIFSWDDYDTFRKIPANMPNRDKLKKYMFQPIVDTPDPYGKEESYAAHHEKAFMDQLPKVGVALEPLYQAQKYRNGDYLAAIKKTLLARDKIKAILDGHRQTPLPDGWWPVSVYCEKCNRDKMSEVNFDGQNSVSYTCELCSHCGVENLENSKRLKLPWRLDWPMRWAYEKLDFEPGGKDHSSQGGSYTTAKEIVAQVYDWRPPVYLQYDFVSIKGKGGKMSSSSGEVVTVDDVLCVYEPEMVRWIFASYKSNVDFAVSFDLDVIKTYEDFDRQERLAYGVESGNAKKVALAKRVYQLSQIEGAPPENMPFQPSFRHLCNILQINDMDLKRARNYYGESTQNERDERRFTERAQCALFWLEHYAPEEFKFQLNTTPISCPTDAKQGQFLRQLVEFLTGHWDELESDKALHDKIYELMHAHELSPGDVFPLLYRKLIGKDKGPKLAGFILAIGQKRCVSLLG